MAAGVTLYTGEILRLAASLPEPAVLDRVDAGAEARSPTCGSWVRLQLSADSEGRVESISQQVHACAFGQAAAALVEASARGRTHAEVAKALVDTEQWLEGKRDDPGSWPGMEALAPARSRRSRHGAILLSLRALSAALSSLQR